MNKQKALRLARKWAQGHVCSLRDGEAEEYHSMFAAMLEESIPNEPLTPCDVCKFSPPSSSDGKPCCMCPAVRRPPEGELNG